VVIAGSAIMILGAISISSAVAPAREQASSRQAVARECQRYGLDLQTATAAQLA